MVAGRVLRIAQGIILVRDLQHKGRCSGPEKNKGKIDRFACSHTARLFRRIYHGSRS